MNNILQKTLATIVTENHQAAAIFEKHSLDFCCKGKRTLYDACVEKNINTESIENELNAALTTEAAKHLPFNEMTEEQLIGHILIHHHFYVKQSMPTIMNHLEKVAMKHGPHFPYMIEVFQLFAEIQQDMTSHMHKEEMILFPRIKQISAAVAEHQTLPDAGFIQGPVNVMEHEHDMAGIIMSKIRVLTNNYTAPEGACTTFKVAISELKAFEEDLHKHIHLENNILFPKAEKFFLN